MWKWGTRCRWFNGKWQGIVEGAISGGLEFGMCKETDPDILNFAHIHGKETKLSKVPRGRGSWYRMVDVFDHPDCYVLLCVDHHREYDKSK